MLTLFSEIFPIYEPSGPRKILTGSKWEAYLSIREYSGVVAVKRRLHQLPDARVVHVLLGGRGLEGVVEGEGALGAQRHPALARRAPRPCAHAASFEHLAWCLRTDSVDENWLSSIVQ